VKKQDDKMIASWDSLASFVNSLYSIATIAKIDICYYNGKRLQLSHIHRRIRELVTLQMND